MDVRYVQEQTIPETEVIIIPATKSPKEKKKQGKRRVAAYCRVSTDDEDDTRASLDELEELAEQKGPAFLHDLQKFWEQVTKLSCSFRKNGRWNPFFRTIMKASIRM